MGTHEGKNGEYKVASLLGRYGREVKRRVYKSPYDLLVDGWRVEVKSSSPLDGENTTWKFNIHRHGRLGETMVDYYVLRLEGVPGSRYALHLLFKSPMKRLTLEVSFRSLVGKYGENLEMFNDFKRGRFGRGTHA